MRGRQSVLLRISQLHIADAARGLLHLTGYALISLAAQTNRPVHFLPPARSPCTLCPSRARRAQVIRKHVGSATAIGAMHDNDVSVRQRVWGIECRNPAVVP